MSSSPSWGLFEVAGLEIEVMAVDARTLEPAPLVDRAIGEVAGFGAGDAEDGAIGWSNELVLHVAEFKNATPVAGFAGVAADFHRSMLRFDACLAKHGAALVPGACHPWMDPATQTVLWPHEFAEVYRAYHRIFDCHRHGWANLQSTHLNLPFRGDQEFRRLHAAVRFLLPALPGLAAASPYLDGRWSGAFDRRVQVYAVNSAKVPQMTGAVIPENAGCEAEYRERILEPLTRAVRALDPSGVLQGDWLNARGAIARFDRDAIEIRLLDAQECPQADIAVAALVVAAARLLVEERHASLAALTAWDTARLRALLDRATVDASRAALDADYVACFGLRAGGSATAGTLWRHLAACALDSDAAAAAGADIERVVASGTLAERLFARAGERPGRGDLEALLRRLRRCLLDGAILPAAEAERAIAPPPAARA